MIQDYRGGRLKGTGELSILALQKYLFSYPIQLKNAIFQIHPNEFRPTIIEPSTARTFCKAFWEILLENFITHVCGS